MYCCPPSEAQTIQGSKNDNPNTFKLWTPIAIHVVLIVGDVLKSPFSASSSSSFHYYYYYAKLNHQSSYSS